MGNIIKILLVLGLLGLNVSAYLLVKELYKIRRSGLDARVYVQEMPKVDVNGVDEIKISGNPLAWPVRVEVK